MPDTLSREDHDALRAFYIDKTSSRLPVHLNPRESVPALLAHIDALTAAVEGLPDFRDRDDMPWPWISRAAVLAILRGES